MIRSRVVVVALATLILASARAEADPDEPRLALRAGWAYGLGLEVEYRPKQWGVGASGGYVPSYGPGGYLGAQWGLHPIGHSGVVAEAGVFRGVENPLRVARTGFGPYLQAGYTFVRGRFTARAVTGGGMPLGDDDHPVSFEFLAKLTFGVTL